MARPRASGRMSVLVRRATPADVSDILALIKALAAYEREPDAVMASEDMLRRALFAFEPKVFAHVAEHDGALIGLALWFLNFSTWTGRHGVYLEDLYVDDAARGLGVGRALMKALAREAVTMGHARLDWAVLDWNEEAKAFYRRVGGRHCVGWEPWRIDGDALIALAT